MTAGVVTSEAADDAGAPILHVDMDAFYASVEVRRRPELRGLPMIVGGGERGVVLSATYEARRYGVRSAMPTGRARRLCPQAVIVRPDFAEYQRTSRVVMEIFRSVTPLVEPLSLDEAFLDVAGARRRIGPPVEIAAAIRRQVEASAGITCSVGVAPSKFVAKVASAHCKPDGLLLVPAGGVLAFLHPLPVSALWGVGARTGEVLARLGLRTVGDIAAMPVDTLRAAVGDAHGTHLAALAAGIDERPVVADGREKSVGAEETFARDIADPVELRRELLRLSERVAGRLRAHGLVGRTVSIKVRYSDFTTVSRARTLPDPTDVGREIYATAGVLLTALRLGGRALRLIGVRVEGLLPATGSSRQLAFEDRVTGWREAERAADRAAARFGAGAVRPAALLRSPDPEAVPPAE